MPQFTGYPREEITAADADLVTKAIALLEEGRNHRQAVRENIWRYTKAQYEGRTWTQEDTEDPTADLTVVNISFGTIQTIKPYITGREPRFFLEPFSSDATRLAAALQEVFLNRIWRHPPVGAQQALRSAAFDFLTYGDGFMKGTYLAVVRETEEEPVTSIELHVDRVNFWDVWIDPYALSLDDARWVANRIWMTEDEARADTKYNIPPDYKFGDRRIADDDRENRTDTGLTDGQQWVQLIEFYDVTNGVMVAFPYSSPTESQGAQAPSRPWRVVDDMALPLVQIPNYDISDSPWHMGELENIAKLQVELNKTRSELMTHRRRNVAKTFMRAGVLGDGAEAALQSPIVNEIVEIETQEPLQNVVIPYQGTPLTADNYQASSEIKDDIREITGITEYQRGIAPDITRTATEASIMDAAANVKLQSKLTSIEEASRRMGSIVLGICREIFPQTDADEWAMFVGGDEAQRLGRMAQGDVASSMYESGDVAGAMETMSQELPTETEVAPTEEMFIGDYEVLVETGSTEYRDPKMRQERLQSMFFDLAGIAPQLQQMGVNVDVSRMLRLWLESTDIIDVDSLLAPPQQPPMGGMGGQAPPEEASLGLPAPEDAQLTDNTGLLETGQIAPAVAGYGEPV